MSLPATSASVEVTSRIRVVRDQKVLLDSDLAELHVVSTKRLNEAVKRNADRFPVDFSFPVSRDEDAALKSQIATSRSGHGGRRRSLPRAFTEHGAIMAATLAFEVTICDLKRLSCCF